MRPWKAPTQLTRGQFEDKLKRRVEFELPEFVKACRAAASRGIKTITIRTGAFDDDDYEEIQLWRLAVTYAEMMNLSVTFIPQQVADELKKNGVCQFLES